MKPVALLIALSGLLAAGCGSGEKQAFDLPEEKEKSRGRSCSAESSPVPLYPVGQVPLGDYAALPAGHYREIEGEVYLKQAADNIQVHFQHQTRGNEAASRLICANPLSALTFLESRFDGVREFTVGASPSYLPGSYNVVGERAAARVDRLPTGTRVNGEASAVFRLWQNYRVYRLGETEFEIRFAETSLLNEDLAERRMSQRFFFQPATR
jgi:hypothetical protein